jgi:hypothetical protein
MRDAHTRNTVAARAQEYSRAIALTIQTIHRRTTRYRTLVVLFVAIPAISLLGVAILRSWLALLGLLLLAPLGAAFLDTWLVAKWRQGILQLWAGHGLDLQSFRKAIKSVTALPPTTVATMLDTLPTMSYAEALGASDESRRQLFVTLLRAIDMREAYGSTARAAAITLAVAAMITIAANHTWTPLFLVALAPLLVAGSRAMAARELRRSIPAPSALHDAGLTPAMFVVAVSQIDWRGVPAKERARFLGTVSHSSVPVARDDESAADVASS